MKMHRTGRRTMVLQTRITQDDALVALVTQTQLVMDARGRHAAMISTRGSAAGDAQQVTQVASFKQDMQLEDPRFLDIVAEPWWGGPTAVMTTIFPSVILQQQVNSVSTRHIQPDGHGAFSRTIRWPSGSSNVRPRPSQ